MRGVNRAIIIGNLGNDPDLKYTQSGAAICTISVATSESYKDKTSGELVETTEWHRIKLFGKLGEIAGEYLKKGSAVFIQGKIKTSKYTDKAGVEKYSTDIIADEMQMLGGKGEKSDAPRSQAPPSNAPPSRNDEPFKEDDIPF